MAFRSAAILLVALATTLANQQAGSTCGCQQQPVIIQMSCGGAQQHQPPPPPPPPTCEAPAPAPPAPAPGLAPAPAPAPAPGGDSDPVTCYEDNDLVIAVDESGSVGEEDYRTSLEFAAKLAAAWRSHPGNRVGVILFSHDVRTWITLPESANLSPDEIRNKILSADYDSGGTSIDLALDACRNEIAQNARPGIPHNVVFLTDGSSNEVTTERAAHDLYQDGSVRGFSVGVGAYISQVELMSIAQKKQDHLFTTDEYDHLLQLLRPLSEKVCSV